MGSGFVLQKQAGLHYLEIPAFSETGLVKGGFSTRHGGVSSGPYATLNLGLGKEDGIENVLENRRRFLAALGLELNDLVTAQQVHGTKVAVVTGEHRGQGAYTYDHGLPHTDAMVTSEKGVILSTYFADCVPLFFLDTVTPAIGLAHAGWKGTVARIGVATLQTMKERFGTKPKDCLVAIGPSIGPCCYEVDEYVVSPLQEAFPYWEDLVTRTGPDRWHLNLWKTNAQPLLELGVPGANLVRADICTACNSETFFSYRAHAKKTGSLSAVMTLQ